MDNSENSADVSGLGESFLSQGSSQYVVDGSQDSGSGDEAGALGGDGEPLREQDRFLPIANVARIMKKSIPRSGKIAKDAKECVQECVSEFISFITSEASERCHQEKRKTINGEDILFAMSNLGFDNYVEPLKIYLQKYRETLHQSQTKMEKGVLDASGSLDELGAGDGAFATTVTLTGDILESGGQPVIYTAAYTDSAQMSLP